MTITSNTKRLSSSLTKFSSSVASIKPKSTLKNVALSFDNVETTVYDTSSSANVVLLGVNISEDTAIKEAVQLASTQIKNDFIARIGGLLK